MNNWPHVTDLLHEAGLVDVRWFTPECRARGTAVHLACQLFDEGDLDPETIDESIAPYLHAYQQFLDDVRPELLSIEESVNNPVYQYVGTLDRRMRINEWETIVDLKCGVASPWHGPQLAGYLGCFPDRYMRRANLYLSGSGIYKLVSRSDANDWPVFRAAHTIANWRRQNAI